MLIESKSVVRCRVLLIVVVALLLAPFISFASTPPKPAFFKPVTDYTSTLSHSEQEYLNSRLTSFYDTTSNQIVIVLVERLENSIESVAQAIGEEWGVGDSKFNNGVVILIKPKIRNESGELFIATGYGVEGVLPDAICKRISDRVIIPHFYDGNYFSGIVKGLEVIEPLVAGEYSYTTYLSEEENLYIGPLIIFALLSLFLFSFRRKKGTPQAAFKAPQTAQQRDLSLLNMMLLHNTLRQSMGSYGNSTLNRGGSFGGRGFGGGRFGGGGAGGKW